MALKLPESHSDYPRYGWRDQSAWKAENSHDGFCVNDISAGNQIKIVFKLRDGINK